MLVNKKKFSLGDGLQFEKDKSLKTWGSDKLLKCSCFNIYMGKLFWVWRNFETAKEGIIRECYFLQVEKISLRLMLIFLKLYILTLYRQYFGAVWETVQFSEYFVPFRLKQEKKTSKSSSDNFLFGKDSKRMDCLVSSVFKAVFGQWRLLFLNLFDVKPVKTLRDSKYTKISFNRCQEKIF